MWQVQLGQLGAIGKNAQNVVKRRNMWKSQKGAIGCNWQKCSEWRETSKYVKITKRCNWVRLGAIDSQDPVRQPITTTKSTTPLRVDLDSNASLWYALRDVDSLTIRRILTLTLYLALIYRLRRGCGRCNLVQLGAIGKNAQNVAKNMKIHI